jgi:hypothetical protein
MLRCSSVASLDDRAAAPRARLAIAALDKDAKGALSRLIAAAKRQAHVSASQGGHRSMILISEMRR